MPDWLPDTKPSWWGTVRNFAETPGEFVLNIVLTAIVSGVLTVATVGVRAVRDAVAVLAVLPRTLEDVVTFAVGPAAELLVSLPATARAELLAWATSLGWAAPFVLVPLGAAWAYLAYRAAVWLFGFGKTLVVDTINPL